MSNRRMEALRAMAEQDESTVERDIAREKLTLLERKEAAEVRRFTPAEVRWLAEQRQRDLDRATEEATRADILKRWERGEFAGVTARMGSTNEVKYRRTP